jgi:hypothetical protein
VAEVLSMRRAEQIADLLNAAEAGNLPPRASREVEYSRYMATKDERGRPVVLWAGWGDAHAVLRANDEELVQRVAALLERVDPPQKVRRGFGIRWW